MKAIIIISSIFYILGLKISNKIDLIKSSSKIEKVNIQKIAPSKAEENIDYKEAEINAVDKDTVVCGGQSSNKILEYK